MEMSELKECLEYIASSPPEEHGGFHPQTVKIAVAALELIQRLEAEITDLKRGRKYL